MRVSALFFLIFSLFLQNRSKVGRKSSKRKGHQIGLGLGFIATKNQAAPVRCESGIKFIISVLSHSAQAIVDEVEIEEIEVSVWVRRKDQHRPVFGKSDIDFLVGGVG